METMIELLKKELEIYSEMLKLSKDKTDIIMKDKVKELDEMVKREEELIGEFIKIEKDRLAIAQEISIKHGSDDIMKIPELCKFYPENEEILMDLRKQILDTLKELKNKTELNEKLIKSSLDYINFAVGLATGTATGNGIYGNEGKMGSGEARKFFDMSL